MRLTSRCRSILVGIHSLTHAAVYALTVLDQAPDAIVLLSAEGDCVHVNPAANRLLTELGWLGRRRSQRELSETLRLELAAAQRSSRSSSVRTRILKGAGRTILAALFGIANDDQ